MNGIKPDPDMKMDPDAITPSGSGYMDDDFYEDTGELQLPPRGIEKDVWLTRIPKWLYEAVSKWEDVADGPDSEQIIIGEVLALPDEMRQGGLSKKEPMRVFLNNKAIHEKRLPQAFELSMNPTTNDVLGNTYIFTEKDLPGYRSNGYRQTTSNFQGVQDPKSRVQKRSKYKKAIPKQTALIGSTTREYTANPLPTREYIEFNKQRTREAIQGRETKTNIVDNLNDHTLSLNVQKMFKTFIKPNVPAKSQVNKAARIPRNDLIDLLHICFDEFKYWSLKALKNRTKQPEAYLKETVSEIADLVKSGTFASHWVRRDMYNRDTSNQAAGAAPGGEDAEDDGEEEMEDVI